MIINQELKDELAVLIRYFQLKDIKDIDKAKYLDIILYSREQIQLENKAMGMAKNPELAPWGIISIKPTNVNYETPMTPMTMLRNALGKEQGGSGISLDKEKYNQSVDFWKQHAELK